MIYTSSIGESWWNDEEVTYKCNRCKIDISTMKNLTKPRKYRWVCKCGKDVSKIKFKQLADNLYEMIKNC